MKVIKDEYVDINDGAAAAIDPHQFITYLFYAAKGIKDSFLFSEMREIRDAIRKDLSDNCNAYIIWTKECVEYDLEILRDTLKSLYINNDNRILKVEELDKLYGSISVRFTEEFDKYFLSIIKEACCKVIPDYKKIGKEQENNLREAPISSGVSEFTNAIKPHKYMFKGAESDSACNITYPEAKKYDTPHYCPFCNSMNLINTEVNIKCKHCNKLFVIYKQLGIEEEVKEEALVEKKDEGYDESLSVVKMSFTQFLIYFFYAIKLLSRKRYWSLTELQTIKDNAIAIMEKQQHYCVSIEQIADANGECRDSLGDYNVLIHEVSGSTLFISYIPERINRAFFEALHESDDFNKKFCNVLAKIAQE